MHKHTDIETNTWYTHLRKRKGKKTWKREINENLRGLFENRELGGFGISNESGDRSEVSRWRMVSEQVGLLILRGGGFWNQCGDRDLQLISDK